METTIHQSHVLSWLTFLPLAGALFVLATPSASVKLQRMVALGVTLAVAALGAWLFARFDPGARHAQFVADAAWFELPGSAVSYRLGLDGLSVLLVALTAVLMPIVILSTWGHVERRVKEFMAWMLVMETGMLGVFLSLDVVLFYVFWEVSLIPLYFLIGIWGGERRLYATLKFFLFTFAGSLVMLVAVIALIWRAQSSDVYALSRAAASFPLEVQLWLFAGFALAFAVKVPLLPLHTWLADAHTEAPTSGSVVLAGVLLKMGTYGFLRFGIGMFPGATLELAPLFMALGAIGIVYGALLALAQTDLKRLVAVSSVSHLGYVMLGMFALTPAGISGGLLQMVNHGLSTGLLFLLVGMLYERRHTRALDQFGGIAASMPLFALFFVVAVLSSAGLPGLNGFVGEYLVLLGAFQSAPLWSALGVLGVILGAVYLLVATRKVLWGPLARAENRSLADLSLREAGLMVPLVALCVWIGVRPAYFMDKTETSLAIVLTHVERARASRLAALESERALGAGEHPELGELALTAPAVAGNAR